MKFNQVILFGYSPLFKDIENICIKHGINLFILSGQRQSQLINQLDLKIDKNKIFFLNSLKEKKLEEISKDNQKLLGLSFGSPFIFNQGHIDFFSGNIINSHGAPLPEFKGGGGFSWRILQQEKRGASLMHLISKRIDEGDIVFRHNFEFDKDESLPLDYEKRQLKEDRENILPWLESIINGSSKIIKLKDNKKSDKFFESYFPRLITNIHGFINWDFDIDSLRNHIRAFSKPYPGASTFIKGEKIRIFNCEIKNLKYVHPFLHGLITHIDKEEYQVTVKEGVLKIKRDDVYSQNKKLQLKLGDRFYTPQKYLEKAITSRVFFNANGDFLREYENIN